MHHQVPSGYSFYKIQNWRHSGTKAVCPEQKKPHYLPKTSPLTLDVGQNRLIECLIDEKTDCMHWSGVVFLVSNVFHRERTDLRPPEAIGPKGVQLRQEGGGPYQYFKGNL